MLYPHDAHLVVILSHYFITLHHQNNGKECLLIQLRYDEIAVVLFHLTSITLPREYRFG